MHETRYPMFFAIALDYLPIQASAVPCKHIFSSSAETDTKRHNRLHLVLMEALQMLKFSLKRRRLDFTEGLAMMECDMIELIGDEVDPLAAVSSNNILHGLDAVIARIIGKDDEDE
jgi:hypothetical protein